MSIRIFIPARLSSTRLPNKPLELIGDKTLIEHVHDRATATGYPVTVLTDSEQMVKQFPAMDVRVTKDAATGTDRVAQALGWYNEDVFVNCQGDLPFIDPQQILQAVLCLDHPNTDVGTLITDMPEEKQRDPNTVKAICSSLDGQFYRLNWCARANIGYGYQHVGVYAFRRSTLEKWPREQSLYETFESLEQLRWIDHQFNIVAAKTVAVPPEVNTQYDLEAARLYWQQTAINRG